MIYSASDLPLPARLQADVCVVGAGAGGSAAAMVAAEAGRSVVVLEPGAYLTPADMNQREEDMLPQLLWSSGAQTTADRGVHVHQGRGVGGSTLHNLNLCKRIPDALIARWREERGLAQLPPAVWGALYDEVEALLAVSAVPRTRWNRHNQLLEAGCHALGWRGGGLSHNRSGCVGSGFCELGCAYDAKNNALKVLLPRAIRAGAEVITRCQAVTVRHEGGRARGVEAVALDPRTGRPLGPVVVEAERVVLAASATGTAALLRRSEVPDPHEQVGRTLRLHPAATVAGEFEAPVRAWEGIPQTYECTEWLDLEGTGGHRSWIVPAFAHPMGFAALLPGHGAAHRGLMERYAHLAVLSAMLHDETAGSVVPSGELGLSIDYWPHAADRAELAFGVWKCAELLFAAGATRVHVPSRVPRVLERGASLEDLRELEVIRGEVELTAVHPMGSVPMADDPRQGAADSAGRYHHLEGLWISDGSLFPSSIGVPPQLSIYALGLHVGRALLRA